MTPEELLAAPRHRFADWPNRDLPGWRAGVYAIWRGDEFIYVGMAGRGLARDAHLTEQAAAGGRKGLQDRLGSHASGRRSGDQFCIYVCDRLIVPTLTPAQLAEVGCGELSLDTMTREYIRQRLSYAYIVTDDGAAAYEVERQIQREGLGGHLPLLNPGRR